MDIIVEISDNFFTITANKGFLGFLKEIKKIIKDLPDSNY